MLKVQIFNAKHPTNSQNLEFFLDTTQQECLIGRAANCNILLPSAEISEVQGCIRPVKGLYYFIPLVNSEKLFFNEAAVQDQQQYLLDTDDIIRIQEFVLIIDTLSPTQKPKVEKNQNIPNGKGNTRSLNQIKSLLKKKNTASPKPFLPLPFPIASAPTQEITPPTSDNPKSTELTVHCVNIIPETHDVKTFRFVATPPIPFTYQPGQFVTLKLNINGKTVQRSYSISSTPSRPHILEITVKRVPPPPDIPDAPPGLVSNWLHDHLKVGDSIEIKKPSGKFTCIDHPQKKLLFICAGSGITPMMSMSRYAYDTVTEHDIIFFHSARSLEDIIYHQELLLMAERHPKLHLAISLTRVTPDQTWQGLTGRLDATMLQQVAPDYQERTVYVCGPNAFMEGVKTLLETLNFPMENYFEESFGGVKKTASEGSKLALTEGCVVFSQSGKEVTSNGEEAILDLAEQEAIDINYSCRSGSCGSCKVRKLEGDIQYQGEPTALDETEKMQDYILACIAHPVGKVLIEA